MFKRKEKPIEFYQKKVSKYTFTDRHVVDTGLKNIEDAKRVYKDVLSLRRKKYSMMVLSAVFAANALVAGALKSTKENNDSNETIDNIILLYETSSNDLGELITAFVGDEDGSASKGDLAKQKQDDDIVYTREEVDMMLSGYRFASGGLAGVFGVLSMLYSSRRELHRADIKQLADIQQNKKLMDQNDQIIVALKGRSPKMS